MKHLATTLISAFALLAAPAAAETIAITGGKLVIGDGSPPIEGATVVIRNDKVVAAGRNVTIPANARQIDANGKWVTPGIFAGFSRVGLVEVGAVSQTNDVNARNSVFSAALDIQYAVNPFASPMSVNRAAGITRAVVSPSTASSIFGGYGAIVDLGQDSQPITKAKAFQFVELGETGHSRAGGSRAATHILFRAMLNEARKFARNPSSLDTDLMKASDAQALLPVINGSTRLLVHVESANDILKVLDLRKEYPALKLVLVGANEGWRVASEIAAARVPVLASALVDLPERFENLAATQSNIGRMQDAGVQVAIGMINDRDAHQLRYSPQYAGNLVALNKIPRASGLSWDEAFAAISSKPAEIMGMGSQLGSLKAGRKADVVIWSGDPLELSTQVEAVIIDGVEQSLSNRQERLRERYRNPTPGALPKAYDR
ncbi:amidohydrolase family protein [Parasphingorhabdus sp.]|uniref:amidohydrolase family protein n=1 Tax=Parasphingorhabdus sp. TaxID=2709688 RepID=UPI003262DB6F